MAEAEAEARQCAICFEAIDSGIDLPCRCKADYCAQCWDKSLAKSFNSCAKARCPSCRAPVRVDYDASSDRLVFTAEVTDEQVDETRSRLALQLRPVQVRILNAFGTSHPVSPEELRSADEAAVQLLASGHEGPQLVPCDDAPAAALHSSGAEAGLDSAMSAEMLSEVDRLAADAAQAREGGSHRGGAPTADKVAVADARTQAALRHAARLAGCGFSPECVCGSSLELISLRERRRRFEVQADSWRYSQQFAPVLANGTMRIVCDLCNRPLAHDHINREFVWACRTGDSTIKHATSNDICARCFVLHVWGISEVEALE